MVNVLNTIICKELHDMFQDFDECVLVDFQGLSVEEVNTFRAGLTGNNIQMQVVKGTLANLVLKDLEWKDHEPLFEGPTAVVWGGDGIVQVSKSVSNFAKKSKKLKIKGGFLAKEAIDTEAIKKLTTVPDRPILLGMLVNCFMDPLQGFASGLGQLLSPIAGLIEALREKRESEGAAEGQT